MSQGKQLPPVASDPITTLLTSRFTDPADHPSQPPEPSAAPPVRTRREPVGMTRQTIYVPRVTADLLNSAAARVLAATGGRVSKHEALSAIIAAGVERADTAVGKVRETLLRDLQQESAE